MGHDLPSGEDELDGRGGTLLPGLHDHHLHILALAARRHSVDLSGVTDPELIAARLRASPEPFVRSTGYDERSAGLPDRTLLDLWLPDRPLKVQDRTGALWILNSAALAGLPEDGLPSGAERDGQGRLTGRFWREDQWLRSALPKRYPDLVGLGCDLAAMGLTSLTDATAHNGPSEACALAGVLPQRLTLMGSEALEQGAGYTLGPLKLLVDERDPPSIDQLSSRILFARGKGRNVAAHCVTEGELAIYLAALQASGGARKGDRIEHGAIIQDSFISLVAQAGLLVVTNPSFLHDRGDRYLDQLDDTEDLYRIRSLQRAGIPVVAGSDAPYAAVDPWLGMRSARDRLTARGALIGVDERIPGLAALQMYCCGDIKLGTKADLILCEGSLDQIIADLDARHVQNTFIAGKLAYTAPACDG